MEPQIQTENILISYLVIPTKKFNGPQVAVKQQDPLEHSIRLALSWVINIWIIQQGLDTQHNLEKRIRISPSKPSFLNTHLFDGNSRFP